jgi:hypothetical protein
VLLDGERINFAPASPRLEILSVQSTEDPALRAKIIFQPTLETGEHHIEYFITDVNGNSTYHREDFEVAADLTIKDVLNYPNPFYASTEFTYVLTLPAENVNIKIFTLAGRLIKKLDNTPAGTGFNSIFWNGLDADGDKLANGVYLYKITARAGDQQVEVIQKLVVMR